MKTETQVREEVEGLRNLTTAQLKEKYREVFGEQSRSNHKQFPYGPKTGSAWIRGGSSQTALMLAIMIRREAQSPGPIPVRADRRRRLDESTPVAGH